MRRIIFAAVMLFILINTGAYASEKKEINLSYYQKYPGYFTFYWNEDAGKIWLEIDKFDTEFLYISSLPAGLGSNDVGLDRNRLGFTKVVKFVRVGPKVLLLQPNYDFRAYTENPDEKKAVTDAFAQSVIWGFSIQKDKKNKVIVDATEFFLRDAVNVVGTLKRTNQGDYKLDGTRSAVYLANTKNFPLNTEIEALLTFNGKNPGTYVRQVTPSPESITLRQHHSFVQLPDDDYSPRKYDPRSSYGSTGYMDFSAPIEKPLMQRFIERHRLKKQDPAAEISDPVDPIIYYVDRGTPEPIRSALIEGAGWWNEAFEAIGYRNAFQVKLMPEGADPLDIRFNVINWVHRSTRGWSYGGGVTDPRTGEIIKGHVSLGSQRIRQDFLIAQGLIGNYTEDGDNAPELTEMALARIRQLSCHEVGHTLGLGHNYASSVNDRASVMDYPHPLVKIREDGSLDLSESYDVGVGEWDKVSIAYGYQDFPEHVDEEKELETILNNAFDRGLYFLADQDARGAGSAHPLAHLWDNGKSPVDELDRMMKIRAIALADFSEKRIPVGAPLATLEEVLVPIYFYHRYQITAAAKVLGGLYYNHSLRGGVQKLPEIVPAEEQWRALEVLLKTVKPQHLALDPELLNLLLPRAPGYRQSRELFAGYTGPTFDPLAAAESVAKMTVSHIINPQRAARLVDYKNRDKNLPGLDEVIDKLIASTWQTRYMDLRYAEINRAVDYVVLKNLMLLAADKDALPQVCAIALQKLNELESWLSGHLEATKNKNQKAHFNYALTLIKQFKKNPDSFNYPSPKSPPQGEPIG